ncbi:RIP metalloprotease RseP, partial [bacterium]|nr:RIP metalloprotease RseP [bacterium]
NKILISAKDTLHFTIKRDNEILNKDINVVSIGGSVGGFIGINPTIFYKSEAIVEDVEENGPAFKSDLQKGDKIIMINGEKVISWEYMLHAIALNQGEAMKFTIQRGGAIVSRYISPTFNEDLKRWTIGILGRPTESMVPMELVKYGFADAFKMGLKETYKITSMVGEVLGRLVTFQLSYRALGGPILIAKTSMAAAKLGLVPFLYFMAFMSIQLGILNLLPIPVLDGGHIVFLTIEKIIRKPLNIKVRAVANYIGLAVLLSLIVMITWNDLDRFWGIGKLVTNLFN